eukprot:2517593-Rhodomonas_salina.7
MVLPGAVGTGQEHFEARTNPHARPGMFRSLPTHPLCDVRCTVWFDLLARLSGSDKAHGAVRPRSRST